MSPPTSPGAPPPSTVPSLRPGDPNTFTGSDGITRPVQAAGPVGGGVATQSFGGAMPTLSQPRAPQVTMPGLPGVNTGRVSAADRERQGAIGTIDEAIRGIGRPNMRSKRDLLANLMQQRGQLVGQAGTLAGAAAGQTLDAATSVGNQFMAQDGANQRSVYDDAGQTMRTMMADRGLTDRALLDLVPRPEYKVSADGKLRLVTGNDAQTVGGEAGLQMLMPPDPNALRPQDVISAYNEELNMNLGPMASPEQVQAARARLDATPLGQARAEAIKRSMPPPAAAIEELRAGRGTPEQFDAVFGPGAAARYL